MRMVSLIALGLLAAVGCSRQHEGSTSPEPTEVVKPKPPPVKIDRKSITLVNPDTLHASRAEYLTDLLAHSSTGKPYSSNWISMPGTGNLMTFWPVENLDAFFATNDFITLVSSNEGRMVINVDTGLFDRPRF